MAITVIDISKYQGVVDWDRLAGAAQRGEIGAVIIRAGFGTTGGVQPDTQFGRNRDLARTKGVPHGFYHFAYPGRSSGATQATALAKLLGPLQQGEMVALDMEDEQTQGRALLASDVAWTQEFMTAFRLATGVLPLLYVASSTLRRFDWTPVRDMGVRLWVASYGADNGVPGVPPSPAPWGKYALWQYTQRAAVAGFKQVDASVMDGDVADFQAMGRPPSPPMTPIPTVPEETIRAMFETNSYLEACQIVRALYRAYNRDPDEQGPAGDEAGEAYWCRQLARAGRAGTGFKGVLLELVRQLDEAWTRENAGRP